MIDLGSESISSTEYVHLGRITEFRYGRDLGRTFRGHANFDELRRAIQSAMLPSDRALVFVDNHDNQRGHGAGGADILTFYDGAMYRAGVAFVLAHPYGLARIMSSYRWSGGPHRSVAARANFNLVALEQNGETVSWSRDDSKTVVFRLSEFLESLSWYNRKDAKKETLLFRLPHSSRTLVNGRVSQLVSGSRKRSVRLDSRAVEVTERIRTA